MLHAHANLLHTNMLHANMPQAHAAHAHTDKQNTHKDETIHACRMCMHVDKEIEPTYGVLGVKEEHVPHLTGKKSVLEKTNAIAHGKTSLPDGW